MKKINTDRCYAIESNNSVVFLILKKGDKYEKIIANKIRIKRNKR